MPSCSVCVCVCLTFVHCLKTNKDIFSFSPSGSHTILVFPHQTGWQYSDGNTPNEGVECRWGRQKSRFWTYLALVPAVSAATCQVNRVAGGRRPPSRKLWHIAGKSGGVDCGRRRRNVYDKKPQRYAKNNRTAHLTVRSDKSVAYVTNNKRLYSTFLYCWSSLLTDTKHRAASLRQQSYLFIASQANLWHEPCVCVCRLWRCCALPWGLNFSAIFLYRDLGSLCWICMN